MKRLALFICTLLCANVLLAQTTFVIDSLYYSVTSTNPPEVMIYDAKSSITTANIPETVTYQGTDYSVTYIGYEAFYNCNSLTSITIPNSVTSIGERAFANCSSLTSVTIPNSVTSIGDYAFAYCSSLTSVNIGNSVTSIGDRAFRDCSSLTSVVIPNSVTSIGGAVFYNCSSLTSVTLSNNITELPCYYNYYYDDYYGFFENCNSLTSITIPNSVTSIGERAFAYCSSLTSVTCLRSSGPSLGSYVFVETPNNKTLTIPCGRESEYTDWQNATTWASIDCIVTIGSRFTIGDLTYEVTSETELKVQACTESATSVVIPETVTYQGTTYSVTSIGESAFYNCSSLTSITIPNSVTSIGGGVFYNCSSLTSVTLSNNITELPCYYYDYDYYGFFENCNSLTSITIPNSVTSIGRDAFRNCNSLTSITIPNSVTSIGDWAFRNCSSLTSVVIPNSVISIGEAVFYNCSSLISVTLSNNITELPCYDGYGDYYGFFENCNSLTSITIPNSVTSIGIEAFSGCSSLTSMTIEMNNIPNLNHTGLNTSILQNLTLGENVTSIASGVFNNCSFLQNVTCLATTPPTLADNTVFPYPNIATLTVPCGTLEAYSSPTSFWNMFFNGRIEEDCSGESSLEDLNAVDISFYPNPTDSKVTFSQAIEKVEVIDLSGKTIFTFSNVRIINIESLPAGAYYLRLTNEEKTSLQKVIKQ